MRKTRLRLAMGEELWANYQRMKSVQKVLRWRDNQRERLVRYKGCKCQQCGYDKPSFSAYSFIHRDEATKGFELNSTCWTRKWSDLAAEADKCDLLCLNCAAEMRDAEIVGRLKETE